VDICGFKGEKVGILDSPNFRGRSAAKLDTKGRLRIPAKFREVIQNHYTDALMISQYAECLVAYPPEKWDEVEAKALQLSQVQADHRSFVRLFISGAEKCEFDNQGRILIPPLLRADAHLDQEVIIVGMLTNFEIWNKATYDLQVVRDKQNEEKIMATIATSGLL
jgi:MraZ protein